MIFLLFIICFLLVIYSYNSSKLKFLSPTFIESGMFAIFSFVYCITFFSMKSDISIMTLLTIVLFIITTGIGEYIGLRIKVKRKPKGENRIISPVLGTIRISKVKILLITILFMVVAVDRYRNLKVVAMKYLNSSGFSGALEMISAARLAFVDSNRDLKLSSTLFNQLIYMCEITVYFMLFAFIYNYFSQKKKDWFYLLPLIPDIAIRFLSTSRTSFIILLVAILVCIVTMLIKNQKIKRIKIPKKVIVYVCLFALIFVLYGRERNNAFSIPMVNYIQMYTCSAIYGLDYFLINGWDKNPYFGFNTMQGIYSSFGITHESVPGWQTMVVFSKNNIHANLCTSYLSPIKDFSIAGSLIFRFFAAMIVTAVLISYLKSENNSKRIYVSLYFVITFVYCYFYSVIGDVFKDVFFNPSLMLRYFVYSFLLYRLYFKPKIVDDAMI